MQLAVASGKGGTGKTTFAVNLAFALSERGDDVRLLDCDVEEPNCHLFVRPRFRSDRDVTVLKPVWDETRCTGCGKCAEACNYNAIAVAGGKVVLFNDLCHSCGVCSAVCPEGALSERPTAIGTVRIADGDPFFFADGTLNIGEPLAPTVVEAVKKLASPSAVNIIDASPGTSCPVVKAVEGSDAVFLVTEPTPFGLNDLRLAVSLVLKMGIPAGIVINRSDGEDRLITDYAKEVGLPIAGRIPFERKYAEAYSEGAVLAREFPEFRDNLLGIFDRMETALPPLPPEEPVQVHPASSAETPSGSAEDYREIVVISGKGGTGKTTVTASLAHLAEQKVLADNDVDAADLHLLLKPATLESHDFFGGTKAVITPSACIACGECAEACHFDAIRQDGPPTPSGRPAFRVEEVLCEGCGLCSRVCPANAIEDVPHRTGRWFVSATPFGPMVHARLGIAEENSGRLVSRVRERAADIARGRGLGLILGDGPPGTGCPVIASVSGADFVLIVTEPTVSGVHDMERVLRLAAHFRVRTAVLINKADLNPEQAERIRSTCSENGSEVIGEIPFDPLVNRALAAGKSVVEFPDSPAAKAVSAAWEAIRKRLAPAPADGAPG